MSNVRYAKHAEDRLAERGITHEDVEWALSHPTGPPLPGEPGSLWIRGFAAGSRILKVCVRADDREFVITAAWPGQGG